MFIRTKTIKHQKYAYLVENSWNQGVSKQKVSQYLGKVIDEGMTTPATTNAQTIPEIVNELIIAHLKEKGFTGEKTLTNNTITVDLQKNTITSNNKPAVLKINEGYVCSHSLEQAKKQPKNSQELATNLTAAGIKITPEQFITLAQTIIKQTKEEQNKERIEKENAFKNFYY